MPALTFTIPQIIVIPLYVAENVVKLKFDVAENNNINTYTHFFLNIQPVVVFCLIIFHSHCSLLNMILIVVNCIFSLIIGS